MTVTRLVNTLKEGKRLPCPPNCPDEVRTNGLGHFTVIKLLCFHSLSRPARKGWGWGEQERVENAFKIVF